MTATQKAATQKAAIGAATILTSAAGLQVTLALGAPWGDAVLGGRAPTDDGVLPGRLRVLAGVQAGVLLTGAWVVTARAGMWNVNPESRGLRRSTWSVVALMALNTVGNLASTNRFERVVLGSATATVCVLSAFVARSSPGEIPSPVEGIRAGFGARPWESP